MLRFRSKSSSSSAHLTGFGKPRFAHLSSGRLSPSRCPQVLLRDFVASAAPAQGELIGLMINAVLSSVAQLPCLTLTAPSLGVSTPRVVLLHARAPQWRFRRHTAVTLDSIERKTTFSSETPTRIMTVSLFVRCVSFFVVIPRDVEEKVID